MAKSNTKQPDKDPALNVGTAIGTAIGSGTQDIGNPCQPVKKIVEYGWVCPICGKVNAPWVSSCDCSGKTPTWTCQSAGVPYKLDWTQTISQTEAEIKTGKAK